MISTLEKGFVMKKALIALLLLSLLCAAALADTGRVADASEMTEAVDIVPEGLTPVTADRLNDGVYDGIQVESSSSMFKIVGCTLTVKDGVMTALIEMKSEAYGYMYPGTAEEAVAAPTEDLAPLMPLDEGQGFVLPVDALDAAYTCAAFSVRKQAWYPRTLMFRADSLPPEAWKDVATAESLGLADGAYRLDVTLTGAGRIAIQSPAPARVADGACVADIVFTTDRIDYIVMDGVKYAPASVDGGAAFTVPVPAFGVPLSLALDSTAMTPAVEIPCAVTFGVPAN